MSTVADSSPNNVTNLRDVIDVPAPVVDVGDSALRVPSVLSDEPTLELSGLLSMNSVMIPVAPVALPLLGNVSVVGESLIPLVDSNRIPTAGTFKKLVLSPSEFLTRNSSGDTYLYEKQETRFFLICITRKVNTTRVLENEKPKTQNSFFIRNDVHCITPRPVSNRYAIWDNFTFSTRKICQKTAG